MVLQDHRLARLRSDGGNYLHSLSARHEESSARLLVADVDDLIALRASVLDHLGGVLDRTADLVEGELSIRQIFVLQIDDDDSTLGHEGIPWLVPDRIGNSAPILRAGLA